MSDLLDAMEQMAHEHLLLNWRDTLADDVLALAGRVREMDATMAGLRARCVRDETRAEKAEDLVKTGGAECCRLREENDRLRAEYQSGILANGVNARLLEMAEKAEARVKVLERQVGEAASQRDKERARVAVLREALEDEADRSEHEFCGRGIVHLTSCHLCVMERILATLDPAATALTERLKAAEAVIEAVEAGVSKMARTPHVYDTIAAWRKVKGEP